MKKHVYFLLAALISGASQILAQVPTISSFSPTSGEVGSSITITGTNFNMTAANNVVYFGGMKAVVTAASATSLTITVPKGGQYAPITVINTGTNTSVKTSLPFLTTYAGLSAFTVDANSFAAPVNITSNSNNAGILQSGDYLGVADFDGDGKLDVVKGGNSSANVSVSRNISTLGAITTSSFTNTNAGDFATGSAPNAIAIADIDGDGKLDIVVNGASNLSILRNTSTPGTISFAAKVDITVSGVNRVKIADFNGDGLLDIATASFYASAINTYKNTSTVGAISFSSTAVSVSGLSGCRQFNVGDVNNDGLADIIAPTDDGSIYIFVSTATGGTTSFGSSVSVSGGNWYANTGDFNNDGKLDIISGGNNLNIFINGYSSGTFASSDLTLNSGVATGDGYPFFTAGNFNGDAKVDLLTSLQNAGTSVRWSMGNWSSGSFTSSSFTSYAKFASVSAPRQVEYADIDGDKKPDIVTSGGTNAYFQVLRNVIGDGTLPLSISIASFTSSCDHGTVKLDWSTASETDNKAFYVQRSYDAQQWEEIATLNGAGNSSNTIKYSYTDKTHVSSKTVYYRLMQMDFSDKTTYSDVVFSNCNNNNSNITVYPNPATNVITVSGLQAYSTYTLFNVKGDKVLSGAFGQTTENINVAALPAGVYQLVVDNNGIKHTNSVVITK